MNRREFVKFMALLAAGAAAMPEQVEAFEHLYETNTPLVPHGLIAVDEIYIGGSASRSTVANIQLLRADEVILNMACNLYGGIVRWVAAPQQMIIAVAGDLTLICDKPEYHGHILYIDQTGKRQTKIITDRCGIVL